MAQGAKISRTDDFFQIALECLSATPWPRSPRRRHPR